MGWKVVATQLGQHNQVMREIGEVFDLSTYPDGTYPPLIEYLPKKTKDGKVIEDEFTSKVIKTRKLDGSADEPAHRDFAEDRGSQAIRRGPKKGEVMRFGWMKRVPDDTRVGLYPLDDTGNVLDFSGKYQLPQPYVRPYIAEDTRRPHAVMVRGHLTRDPNDDDGAESNEAA